MKILKQETKSEENHNKMKVEDINKKVSRKKTKIMYVNQLNRLSDDLLLENGQLNSKELERRLNERFPAQKSYKWAFIIHDLDKLENGELKPAHVHLIVQNPNGINMGSFKAITEDENLNNYEYLQSRFKASELYIIHDTQKAKEDNKVAYDEQSVIANYDYVSQIKKYRKTRQKEEKKKESSSYIDLILAGKLKEEDFCRFETEEDIERARFYANNKTKIDNALEVRRKILRQECVKNELGEYSDDMLKLEYNEKKCQIFWLYGASGAGKSLTSLLLAKSFSKTKDGSDVYITSGKNDIFQDASVRHKVMIFEEFRPSTFKNNIEELFKVLDNDRIYKSVNRRYKNHDIAPNVIIINSIYNPVDFYAQILANDRKTTYSERCFLIEQAQETEPIKQLLRRVTHMWRVNKKDELEINVSKMRTIECMQSIRKDKYSEEREIRTYDLLEDDTYALEIDEKHENLIRIEFDDLWR